MNKLYYRIKTPKKMLADSFVLPSHKGDRIHVFRLTQQDLSKEIIQWCNEHLGSQPRNIQLFYTPPNWINRGIHTDGPKINDMWAINRVVGGTEKGVMRWYKKKEDLEDNVQLTNADTVYTRFEYKDVEEIERCVVDSDTLVHIGIPHSVDNYDAQPRWCLSIRPYPYTINFHDVVKILFEKGLIEC